jgi:DNA-binding NtrC family response regulator
MNWKNLYQRIRDAILKRPSDDKGREAKMPTPARGRILVVDDEAVIRDVLYRFLKLKGFEVVVAANGMEALAKIKQERPHLMLLDLRMPGMDGLQVLKAAREIDREIAVMMITANNDLDLARKTMELGACDYIIKPFHLEYLRTTVMAKLLMITA